MSVKRGFYILLMVLALTTAGAKPVIRTASAAQDDAPAPTRDRLACANLIYAGTHSSVCFSDRFLAMVTRETTVAAADRFTPVKLSGEEVLGYPFAVMTGEGSFTLGEAERDNPKRYLRNGGFLLASAGCGSSAWDVSFRREIAAMFPERPWESLPGDHAIFHTVFDIDELKTKGADATLLGLTYNDRLVAVYAPDGLNDSASMQGCCCCGGNEILNAQRINANIFVYALLQ